MRTPFSTPWAIWSLALWAWSLTAPLAADPGQRESDPWRADDRLIIEREVGPVTDTSLRELISRFALVGEPRAQAEHYLRQLRSDRFDARDQAMRKLLDLGGTIRPLLLDRVGSGDFEVRLRIRSVLNALDDLEARRAETLAASLREIRRRRLRLDPTMLARTAQFSDRVDLQLVLHQTIRAGAAEGPPASLDKLREAAPWVRVAGLIAAAEATTTPRVLLQEALTDPEPRVRWAAASALLTTEPGAASATLVELLDSQDDVVAHLAAQSLRQATGHAAGFAAYDEAKFRAAAAARWKDWLQQWKPAEGSGELAPLAEHGRLLLCKFSPFLVEEIDPTGRSSFSTKHVESGCGAAVLPDGRRVVADWGGNCVVLLDNHGDVIERLKTPGTPNALAATPTGEIVVGLFDKSRVLVFSPAGQITQNLDVGGQVTDVQILKGQRLLVALFDKNQVVEVDRSGKRMAELTVIAPESARRLGNGNTLVASSRRSVVAEYAPDGRVVWILNGLRQPYDAVELDSGSILVGSKDGLSEYSRDKELVQQWNVGVVRRICRH